MKLFFLALLCLSADAAITTGQITGGSGHTEYLNGNSPYSFTLIGDSPMGSVSFGSCCGNFDFPLHFQAQYLAPNIPNIPISLSGIAAATISTGGALRSLSVASPSFNLVDQQAIYQQAFTLTARFDLCALVFQGFPPTDCAPNQTITHLLVFANGLGITDGIVNLVTLPNQPPGPPVVTLSGGLVNYTITGGSYFLYTDADIPEPSFTLPLGAALAAIAWRAFRRQDRRGSVSHQPRRV